jgi:hypothetical protein
MNEGLKENHTILGLHLLGNEILTDSLGFMTVESGNQNPGAVNDCSTSHIISRISNTLDMGSIRKNKIGLYISSNCWICEGWT